MDIDFSTCKIGFIGAGNMSMAIIKGLIEYGNVNASRIHVSAPSNRNLPKFEKLGCLTTNHNESLVLEYDCSIIFLSVKPHQITPNNPIVNLTQRKHSLVILSVIAGLTLDSLNNMYSANGISEKKLFIYRLMPNIACQVGKGVCGISRSPTLQKFDDCIKDFLGQIFTCYFLPENQLDQITALSGSGIAFVFTFIQAMADGGVKIGFSRDDAVSIATQTISGACALVNDTKTHPIQLRDAVCSAGGITIYGVHTLEKAGMSSAVIDSVTSSFDRCMALKK